MEARAAPAHMMNTIALEASQVFSSAPPIVLSSSVMLLRAVSARNRCDLQVSSKCTERTQKRTVCVKFHYYHPRDG